MNDPAVAVGLARLMQFYLDRYHPGAARRAGGMPSVPPVLVPRKGRLGLVDYE
jgi:hypothetical protein